jgi:hypothetical protein
VGEVQGVGGVVAAAELLYRTAQLAFLREYDAEAVARSSGAKGVRWPATVTSPVSSRARRKSVSEGGIGAI